MRGRVQGVGFRWFTQDAAQKRGVTGWVRNRRDGTVDAELNGTDADVQSVLDLMQQGPTGAHVTEVDVLAASVATSHGFEIRATE